MQTKPVSLPEEEGVEGWWDTKEHHRPPAVRLTGWHICQNHRPSEAAKTPGFKDLS